MIKHAGASSPAQPFIAPTRETTNGSINTLYNLIKLTHAMFYSVNQITGNIETMFTSMNKIQEISLIHCKWVNNNDHWGITSTNLAGNISVLANKYNLLALGIMNYVNINGELKSLKNLKKFFYCYLLRTGCTGSKADLWNNGANITTFNI